MGCCLTKIQDSMPQHNGSEANTQISISSSNSVDRPYTILGKPYDDVNLYYTIGEELGSGGFAVAYLCIENSTGEKFACKSIAKERILTKVEEDDVRREIQILQHLRGRPNVVEFKDVYEDERSVHIVMELCAGGELFDRITAKGYYTERAAASICRAIVHFIHSCHSMGVMHRDIKPENFLLSSKDEIALLKAIDFGLSTFIEEGKFLMISVYYWMISICLLLASFFLFSFSV